MWLYVGVMFSSHAVGEFLNLTKNMSQNYEIHPLLFTKKFYPPSLSLLLLFPSLTDFENVYANYVAGILYTFVVVVCCMFLCVIAEGILLVQLSKIKKKRQEERKKSTMF